MLRNNSMAPCLSGKGYQVGIPTGLSRVCYCSRSPLHDFENRIGHMLSKFTDNTKLGRVANNLEDSSKIQNDLDTFEKSPELKKKNQMKVNKDKCKKY